MELKNQVVAITGASSGIGREIAVEMGLRGARLFLAARRLKMLEEVCELIRENGGEVHARSIDVSPCQGAESVVTEAVDHFGGLDILVNNAGVVLIGPYEESTEQDIHRVLATNLEAAMYSSRAAIPIFKRKGEGAIVNISSMGGLAHPAWITAYSTTKAAVRAFSRSLRVELRPFRIRVIAVYPTDLDTGFASSGIFTPRAERIREILSRPRRLVVSARDVAKVVINALESDKNGDFTIGWRGRIAAFLAIHAAGTMDYALRREYRKLVWLAENAEPLSSPKDHLDEGKTIDVPGGERR